MRLPSAPAVIGLMGGEIRVESIESIESIGTTFYFYIRVENGKSSPEILIPGSATSIKVKTVAVEALCGIRFVLSHAHTDRRRQSYQSTVDQAHP